MELAQWIKSWVRKGGSYDHLLATSREGREKLLGPFKFNSKWMENEEFDNTIIHNWNRYNKRYGNSTIFQFAKCLKQVNKVIGDWEKTKFQTLK
jgi:hypothetical protein